MTDLLSIIMMALLATVFKWIGLSVLSWPVLILAKAFVPNLTATLHNCCSLGAIILLLGSSATITKTRNTK